MNRRTQRHLMSFDSPWCVDPGTVRVFESRDGANQEETSRRLQAGEHKTPFMLETASERQLLFTRSSVQSTMSIDDPNALICAYTQKMMAFLLFNPGPRHIVMIGLGGGSIPKFCYRHLPRSLITVVEIDADVIALREEFCIPQDNARFRVVHDDGARFIASLSEPVDVILVDAFDAHGIAPSLATSNFYVDAAARLSEDGILVMNLSGERSRYPLHLNRLRAVFDDRQLTLPVSSSDNLLVFAFKSQMPRSMTPALKSSAQHLQSQLSLEFPRFLQRLYHDQVAIAAPG
jgi:spermidine synthase